MQGSDYIKNIISLCIGLVIVWIGNYPKITNSSIIFNNIYIPDDYHQTIYDIVNKVKSPIEFKYQFMEKNVEIGDVNINLAQSDISPTVSVTPTSEPEPKIDPGKILIIGDSRIQTEVGIELEIGLEKAYSVESINRLGVPKSGLSRPDFYDWNDKLEELISANNPTLIIVMLGANDGQRIYKDNQPLDVKENEEEWNSEYLERVKNFQRIATDKKISVVWIGNPISGLDYYNTLMIKINSLTQKGAESNKYAYYFDIWNLLTDTENVYTDSITIDGEIVKVRTKDKIHLTRKGGEIVTNHLVDFINENIEYKGTE